MQPLGMQSPTGWPRAGVLSSQQTGRSSDGAEESPAQARRITSNTNCCTKRGLRRPGLCLGWGVLCPERRYHLYPLLRDCLENRGAHRMRSRSCSPLHRCRSRFAYSRHSLCLRCLWRAELLLLPKIPTRSRVPLSPLQVHPQGHQRAAMPGVRGVYMRMADSYCLVAAGGSCVIEPRVIAALRARIRRLYLAI